MPSSGTHSMSEPEAYLFSQRNRKEAKRLNAQHTLLKKFYGGRLLHQSIPLDNVQTAIADVGTGTGVWIRDMARSFHGALKPQLVGFDISSAQFTEKDPDIDFVVHDILTPFPLEFHGKFDLVHVRLLVCALRQESLRDAVKNIVAILRPGGYLQWQEADPNGRICTPPSAIKDAIIRIINEERAARGLTLNIYPSMLKSLLSLSFADEFEALDAPLCITDVMRILSFELHRTNTLALAAIRLEKNAWGFAVLKQMILAGVRRKLNEAKILVANGEEEEVELGKNRKIEVRSNESIESGNIEDNRNRLKAGGGSEDDMKTLMSKKTLEDEAEGLVLNRKLEDTGRKLVPKEGFECEEITSGEVDDEQKERTSNGVSHHGATSNNDKVNGNMNDKSKEYMSNGIIQDYLNDQVISRKVGTKVDGTEVKKLETSQERTGKEDEVDQGPADGLAANGNLGTESNGLVTTGNTKDVDEMKAIELARQAEEAISLVERFGRDLEEGAYDIDATLAWLVAQKTPFTD